MGNRKHELTSRDMVELTDRVREMFIPTQVDVTATFTNDGVTMSITPYRKIHYPEGEKHVVMKGREINVEQITDG